MFCALKEAPEGSDFVVKNGRWNCGSSSSHKFVAVLSPLLLVLRFQRN